MGSIIPYITQPTRGPFFTAQMVMNPFIKSKKDSPTTGEESIMFSIQQVVTNLGDEFHSWGGSTMLVSKDLIVGTLVSSILVSTFF